MQGETRVWLQQALVADGFARVYSFPDNRRGVAELLASEAEARAKHRGVWGVSAYRVREASDLEGLDRLMHSYQLVEGVVVAIGEAGDRLYLNFGEDWRRDFTVSVEGKDAAASPPPDWI
ncbi:MAG: thermonuclease family protein [Methyloceanibacter sp.]|uniref:thermonuclease family protein n=1 Tax=Methyloceanibacter sp. TaxID=1965321 RepID=UPI003D9BF006